MILFISSSINNLGGAAFSAIDVIRSLLYTGKEISVLSPQRIELSVKNNNITNKLKWYRTAKQFKHPGEIRNNVFKEYIKYFIRSFFDILIRKFIYDYKSLSPDIVFLNSSGSIDLFQRFDNTKTYIKVLIVRESPKFFNNDNDLKKVIDAINSFNYIIFVSSRSRDAWSSIANFDLNNSYTIPNCCDEKTVIKLLDSSKVDAKKLAGFSSNNYNVLCVANIQKRKGQDILIDQFSNIEKHIPNLTLYFVGKLIMPFAKQLKDKIDKNDLNDKVVFLGHRNDVLSLIYASDVLVLPSRSEAFPRVILEAMALKTPVIASDVDGITEQIDNLNSGYLFSIDKPQKIVDCFKLITSNKNITKKLVENGHRKYWSSFSMSHQIKRYDNFIKDIKI